MPVQPVRTCVGCRGKAGKHELVRLVAGRAGTVVVDRLGSAPGRGAYVHADGACVGAALSRGALGRALRTRLLPEATARLRNELDEVIGTT